jgi:hypothetical protein
VQEGSEVGAEWFPRYPLPATNSATTMNTYKTRNFYLSAFLESSGIPLVSHERSDGKTTFEFAQIDGLPQLIHDYFSDQVRVSPIRYGNSLKNLKALIYSGNTNMNTNGQQYINNAGSSK